MRSFRSTWVQAIVILMAFAAVAGRPAVSQVPGHAIMLRTGPAYPEVARRMHVTGTVRVEVTAMPDGSAARVHAVAGHPLLLKAAEDCVSQWRFMRTAGKARGSVEVVFSLDD